MEKKVLNSLIDRKGISEEDGLYTAVFSIDPENEIFKGHFPEQAILPGVVMVNIVKDCLEEVEETPLQLHQASNIKFLNLLIPNTQLYQLKFTIKKEEDLIKVNATLIQDSTVYFKQNASYKSRK